MKEIRCAIYTRKSHEEGLDQEYNSLDAQRDACEAYIKSQANEGWKLINNHYDDGGFSGGTLLRPALQDLLQDIRDDKVDTIVVYKIDRLTRSLMDFSNIMEVLDKSEASFVSVTQHFNTTSSMGRLTLNVLLSFAQFEREITGERIRDKIAASKKRGMWTGGYPPLGYDVVDKKLVINPKEANDVRTVFERYAALGSVTDLESDLVQRDIRTKSWKSAEGKLRGGDHYKRGALYRLLQNKLYRGEIEYKGKVYQGEHQAIVPKPLWDEVQDKMESNRRKQRDTKNRRAAYLLEGLIYDSSGFVMSPTYSVKKGNRRYPYYVSAPIIGRRKVAVGEVPRVPAQPIEDLVRDRLASIMGLQDPSSVNSDLTRKVLKKVTIFENFVELEVTHSNQNTDCGRLKGNGDEVTRLDQYTHIRVAASLQKHSVKLAFVNSAGSSVTNSRKLDSVLTKNLAIAFKWRESLEAGRFTTLQQIADDEGCTEGFVRKMIALAYLAPDIIESILEGQQPASFDLKKLHFQSLPLSWDAQRKVLGFTA